MRRSGLFRTSLLALFLSLLCAPALAWDHKDFSGKEAEVLMRVMDNLAYIADGEDNGKHLYVIFSPGCPACKAFFDISRKNPGKAQIRWVPLDLEGDLNSMFEKSSGDVLKEAFVNASLPADTEAEKTAAIARYNNTSLFWLTLGGLLCEDGNLAYPTFVYGDKNKASVSIGLDQNLKFDKFIAPIPSAEPDKERIPDALRLAGEKFDLIPTPGITEYSTGSEERTVRAFPSKDAVALGVFKPNSTLPAPVVGATKNGYVAVEIGGNNLYFFVEDENAAKAALEKVNK